MSTLTLIDGLLRVDANNNLVLSADAETPCCCAWCWEETVSFTQVLDQPGRECDPVIKETKFLTIPEWVCVPASAQIIWNADDDIAINGARLNNRCFAGSGEKRLTITQRILQLDLIDTVGTNWGGSVTIKICQTDCI